MASAKVLRPKQFQRAPAKRRSAAAEKPRELVTYDVTYTYIGGEVHTESFRLRAPQLTKAQLTSKGALIGEIAVRVGAKWSSYSYGALPACSEGARLIREAGEQASVDSDRH